MGGADTETVSAVFSPSLSVRAFTGEGHSQSQIPLLKSLHLASDSQVQCMSHRVQNRPAQEETGLRVSFPGKGWWRGPVSRCGPQGSPDKLPEPKELRAAPPRPAPMSLSVRRPATRIWPHRTKQTPVLWSQKA